MFVKVCYLFLVRHAFQVVDYLQCNDIAHNLFITRGTAFNGSQSTVRVYIWPRESVLGQFIIVLTLSSKQLILFRDIQLVCAVCCQSTRLYMSVAAANVAS